MTPSRYCIPHIYVRMLTKHETEGLNFQLHVRLHDELTLSNEASLRKLEARVLLGSKQSYRHGSKRDNDDQLYAGNKFTSGACCRLSL